MNTSIRKWKVFNTGEGPLQVQGIVIMQFLVRINHTFANLPVTTASYLLTQKLSTKCSTTVQDNRKFGVRRGPWVCGAHFSSIQDTLFLCFINRHRHISVSIVTFKLEVFISLLSYKYITQKTFTLFKQMLLINVVSFHRTNNYCKIAVSFITFK